MLGFGSEGGSKWALNDTPQNRSSSRLGRRRSRWRKEYGGMKSDQAKRLKLLERENTKLKQIVAELSLDKKILAEALRGNF